MKKFIKPCFFALALSLCVGTAAISGNKSPSRVVADDGGLEFVMTNDSTCSDTMFYSREGSDFQYLDWTTLNKNNTSHFSIPGATTNNYTVSEDSSNKMYNYCYRPFFIYPRFKGTGYMEAKKRYVIDVTFNLSLTKTASGGAAYAHAELFFLGNGNGQPTPVLTNNRFETPTEHNQNYTNSYGSASNTNKSIGCYTKIVNSAVVATKQLSITFDNETTAPQVVRYQLGLFVGCNYGSSYAHQASAVVSYTINSVTKYDVVAENAGNAYLSIDEAIDAAASGSTVNVLSDCNWSIDQNESTYLAKNLTINLNGHTVSMTQYNDGIGVKNNSTITINGGGGTLRNNANDNQYAQPLLLVKAGSTMIVSNVTLSKPNGSHGVVEVYGTFTADSTVTISTNSSYLNGCGVLVYGTSATVTLTGTSVSTRQSAILVQQGGTFKSNGATITSTNYYAIETDSCVSYSNSVYVYGATTLSYGGSATAHIYLSATGNNDKVYATANGKTFLTKAVTVRLSSNVAEGTTVVSSDKNGKISITNTPATGFEYATVDGDIVYRKKTCTIYFSKNGGTGSMSSVALAYGTNYVVPDCSFTAPAGKKFLEWNTNSGGAGNSFAPGDSLNITYGMTLNAIWVDTAQTKISNEQSTTDLYYRYHKYDNGTFSYSNVAMRFGALMSKALWDELATETTIQGYGVLISPEVHINANPVSLYYNQASTDSYVEDYYVPKAQKAVPSLATDTQKGELVGDYYIWNLFYNISSEDLTKVYVAAAYIKTTAGVVFLNEIRTSAAKNAYDMIQAGMDEGTANGSLKNLADMYN